MATESNRGELIEKVIKIKRCAAVVKGGGASASRPWSWSATAAARWAGATARPTKFRPASKRRQGRLAEHDRSRHRRRHDSAPGRGALRRGRVVLVPAAPGTGVIAGSAVRAVCEAAGIHDILTKSFGSNNPTNLVKAAMQALDQLRTRHEVERCGESRCHEPDRRQSRHSQTQEAETRRPRARARATARPAVAATRARGSWPAGRAPPIFEGGASPLIRRIPKRGFHNALAKTVVVRQRRRPGARHSRPATKSRSRPCAKRTWSTDASTGEDPGRRRADQEAEDLGPSLQPHGAWPRSRKPAARRSCCPSPREARSSQGSGQEEGQEAGAKQVTSEHASRVTWRDACVPADA